ncbi:DinB family protein [Aestuariivivens sediminis]|uniref:DinB family protein n=1 Tax=Aestuariivivens sediminis TaxID=2913557 RepID=UPI001F5645D4|nr:DinB family protein [Aestuariivivens sediminis]
MFKIAIKGEHRFTIRIGMVLISRSAFHPIPLQYYIMNINTIIRQYDFNLEYAKVLIHDLSEEQMTIVPAIGLDNHPAFTIGHLISGSADLARDLGASFEMPDAWAALFVRQGPGDPRKPDPDKNKYPSKLVLINELEKQHNKVKQLLTEVDKHKLKKPLSWRFSNFMPTLGDVVTFMCINHESMHLGQLAAWRRSMGLESALALVKHNNKN